MFVVAEDLVEEKAKLRLTFGQYSPSTLFLSIPRGTEILISCSCSRCHHGPLDERLGVRFARLDPWTSPPLNFPLTFRAQLRSAFIPLASPPYSPSLVPKIDMNAFMTSLALRVPTRYCTRTA